MSSEGKKVSAATGTDPESALPDRAPDSGKMEQVRDLLFGSQMREIERRLRDSSARFEGELAVLSGHMSQRVPELDAKIDSAAERASHLLRQEADVRNKAIEDLEDRIGQLIRTVRGEVMARLEQLQGEMSRNDAQMRETVERMGRDVAQANAELRNTISKNHEGLEASKAGKSDLAAILAELSLRVAGEPAAD